MKRVSKTGKFCPSLLYVCAQGTTSSLQYFFTVRAKPTVIRESSSMVSSSQLMLSHLGYFLSIVLMTKIYCIDIWNEDDLSWFLSSSSSSLICWMVGIENHHQWSQNYYYLVLVHNPCISDTFHSFQFLIISTDMLNSDAGIGFR